MITQGALLFAPYNLSYMIPAVYLTLFSWVYVKRRYLEFWSKYNYITAAAWSAGIAVSAIVIFFALDIPDVSINWWGNYVYLGGEDNSGCEGIACRRLAVPGAYPWSTRTSLSFFLLRLTFLVQIQDTSDPLQAPIVSHKMRKHVESRGSGAVSAQAG
jgi:hypothetical protein